jgi:hypothetical protein
MIILSIESLSDRRFTMLATQCEYMGMVFQDEAEAVSFVAGLLEISEFRLFEMAYENWFGSEATEKAIDGFFGNYLKSGFIPFWLRNMVRTIICEYRKGNLTPSRFGIDQRYVSPSRNKIGWILMGLFYFLVFAIVYGSATFQPY